MYSTLWARELGKAIDNMFAEGANIGKVWARLEGGGIFEETRRFVICNYDIHVVNRMHKRGRFVE